jgi:three-Cys-motif partner protein
MKAPGYYRGKEQTYLKHFFLESYLETVAFHILNAHSDFVYVDCFSGPWRPEHEDLADTSIRISLDKLNYVRNVLAADEKCPTIRAIFIEKDRAAFGALQQALEQYHGAIQTAALPGAFEDNIPGILKEMGDAFAFCFIDPTGWKLSMDRIQPFLIHRPGEVMINFMYDFVNRFLNSQDAATEMSLDRFFGTKTWRSLRDRPDRESAIIGLYENQVRSLGNFPYVTSTKILKPLHERAYFHLIYATRSSKGIEKFRDVEKRLVLAQGPVREVAQREHRQQRTGQEELPFGGSGTFTPSVRDERAAQRKAAKLSLFDLLQHGPRRYEDLLAHLLQLPLFWKTDLHDLLMEEYRADHVIIEGMTSRQRVPNERCIVRLADPGGPAAGLGRPKGR